MMAKKKEQDTRKFKVFFQADNRPVYLGDGIDEQVADGQSRRLVEATYVKEV